MFTTYMQASQTLRLYAICLQQTRSVYLALVGNPGPISLLHGPNHMPHLAISNGKKKNIIFPIEISHLGVYVGIPHFGGETSENHVTSCDHHTRDNHMDGKFNHIQVSRGGATPWLIFDFSANKNVLCIMQL